MSGNKETKIEQAIAKMEKVAKSEKLMEIPYEIIGETGKLFRSLIEDGFDSGYSDVINALACLYHLIRTDPSCPAISFRQFKEAIPDKYRENGFTITPRYDPKKIFRSYQKIVEKYGIAPQTCTVRPTIFVKKFGPMMGFGNTTLEKAVALAEEMVKRRVHQGRSPIVSAAACLRVIDLQYGKKRDLREIAELCGVTDAAINKALVLPFFAGKIPRKEVKYLKKTVLLRFLRKLIKVSLRDEGPMPIINLKKRLRLSLPDEFKNHQIGRKEFLGALKTLELESLLFVVPLGECSRIGHIPGIHCLDCAENLRFWFPCRGARVLFKKNKPNQ